MKTNLRLHAAAILASLGFALPAAATTATIDYSDLWYNRPAESQAGWGVNVMQQGNVLFVTLFVFGTDNTPRWYVASNVSSTSANSFSGALYNVASGTYFGAPWAGISGVTQVGNIAFTFDSDTTGTMTYTVNNVQVSKLIVRQSWRTDNLTGNYIGGTTAVGSACGGNGGILISGELTVSHSQPNITMFVDFVNNLGQQGRCTYGGTYNQVGSVGSITGGSYNCTIGGTPNAITGTYSVSEIRNTRNGFNGRINGSTQFCSYSGFFGGIKDVF